MRQALDKDRLRQVYQQVARYYDLQHAMLTLGADQRGRRWLVRHAVNSGNLVLDCGGGTGSSALLAAEGVGPAGRVVLFDMSATMLEVAVRRSAAAGKSDVINPLQGNMLELPFAAECFDVVVSSYSLCPLGEPADGVTEMWRVLRPGGRLALAYSSEPKSPRLKRLAGCLENLVWRFPGLSLGCRPVDVWPTLQEMGGQLLAERRIGPLLWPFQLLLIGKPL